VKRETEISGFDCSSLRRDFVIFNNPRIYPFSSQKDIFVLGEFEEWYVFENKRLDESQQRH